MTIRLATFSALLIFAACAGTPKPEETAPGAEAPLTVEVMVLGTWHMNSPGSDVVNMTADDVLAPTRQAELADLTRRLAAFQPTAVMVETESQRPDFLDEKFPAFTEEALSENRNEITQVAYRLAREMGIERVYGIDTRSGEIDFFPFDKVQAFEASRGINLTGPMIEEVQANVAEFSDAQSELTISGLYARMNDPESLTREHNDFYYGLFELADAEAQPGAQLNYGWYARNALTFSKVAATTKPGDRVVVLFGAGHAYWLRHFVENTPGYTLVEPVPYLVD